ncbi:MAG: TetR/AcrR family transcriptional regulator [Actinobacteria bacterium]|nr:TetR/AcrR family transcriptional regulator [Actinomycetota bacterium]
MTRTYAMANRAAAASQTAERITTATEYLLGSVPISDITLQAIAQRAGVTVQTVLRHMGSRDGCFAAVGERVAARVQAQRDGTAPGDVHAAISDLVAHYESDGRLVLNLLAQEGSDDPLAREAVESGRAFHRAWVERCFGPMLTNTDQTTIDGLVAATDLYIWKLLRLDLGRSADDTVAVISHLTQTLVEAS